MCKSANNNNNNNRVFYQQTKKKKFIFCRGLCCVYRSRAGQFPEAGDGEPADNPPHNSHWLPEDKGGPSRYVGYYDATSLYPSSSKFLCLKFGRGLGKGR